MPSRGQPAARKQTADTASGFTNRPSADAFVKPATLCMRLRGGSPYPPRGNPL